MKFAIKIYLPNVLAIAMLSKIAMSGIERVLLPNSSINIIKVYVWFPCVTVNGGKENDGKPSVILPVI